jgi:uncharacterized membrane protein
MTGGNFGSVIPVLVAAVILIAIVAGIYRVLSRKQ